MSIFCKKKKEINSRTGGFYALEFRQTVKFTMLNSELKNYPKINLMRNNECEISTFSSSVISLYNLTSALGTMKSP